MDSFTHALTGAVMAKAIDDEKIGNWGTIAGLSLGFFPDTDFVLGLFDRQFYLEYHRDFTHSLLLIPFYALFFSWLFVKISKRSSFWSFYKICFLVLVSHVILDLLTSYGTMILSPFFEHRFSWDLIFIVDFLFSGIIFFPLLVSLFWKRKSQWICRGSLIGLTLYILFCWTQHHQAIKVTKTFAQNLREEIIQVASLPQPLSPFRWANYIETKDRVYQGFVGLLRTEARPTVVRQSDVNHDKERHSFESRNPGVVPAKAGNQSLKNRIPPYQVRGRLGQARNDKLDKIYVVMYRQSESIPGASIVQKIRELDKLYQPPGKIQYQSWQKLDGSSWVQKALTTDGVKFYYWFARFPVVKSVNSNNGRHRVEFMDVRFLMPGVRLPFVYYVEFDDSGKIQSEGFVESRKK